jgi:DNA repair protein RecO (recombination protein O)
MLHKTRGIVFRVTDYRETSVVANIFTEAFGLQGYIINSVRKKNARIKQNVFHPLSLVDLIVYHSERKGLYRVAEIRSSPVLLSISDDVIKTSIIFFLNEVLRKSVKEEEPNQKLFDFIFHSVQLLDMQSPANKDFHLCFLLQLTRYLGFFPQENFSQENSVFNLREGIFQEQIPSHPHFIESTLSKSFFNLIKISGDFSSSLNISTTEKRLLVEKILEYYSLHIEGFGKIKSHEVLEAVWN